MKIKNISKEISWSKYNGLVFIASKGKLNYLNEYLSNQKIDNIDYEIGRLKSFECIMAKSLPEIESYIIKKLGGFNSYGDKFYAHIAGAHDMTVSVLYNIKNNTIFLKHPYFEDEFNIKIEILLSLLEETKQLLLILN
ncbi:hypothetical protein SAMN04487765_1619 [Tenacibaculum sp. MAR_2010_89]|uniref:hypothetical protein n=1 Tax=Tenacibaculum sp. MAR_2010_89 TaxID=1250198 RepID=UPI0008972459|nr:hypothetical protein [Tenacibaculum sp. MAR_2010_89]SEE16549.1 hypothetical protein SAMN04487765_1619 [Tenacibaculum sp. MAR_2010_89]